MTNKLYYIHIEEMTLHNAESSEGFNIALKKIKRKKKEKKKLLQHRIFIFGQPSKCTNPTEQGLTLLGGRLDETRYCPCGIVIPR